MSNKISVLVTGLAWMGSGTRSIESAMEELFRNAHDEILITSYAISNATDLLFEWLEKALIKGIKIRMVINQLDTQHAAVVSRLMQFQQSYPHFHLFDFKGGEENDLHAKTIVVDRKFALIGSSNLSHRGLVTNHEIALLVEGSAAADVANVLEKLMASKYILPPN